MEIERRGHIIMLPFMAQGHIIPFLALALDIEKRKNYKITIINTPINVQTLSSSLPPNSTIRLRSIPFNSSDHGLPPGTENTDSLPYDLIFRLMASTFDLEPALRQLLSEIVEEKQSQQNEPVCMISDFFFAWSARVAHEFGISHAIFAGTSGFGWACYYSLWSNVPRWKEEQLQRQREDDDHDKSCYYSMEDFPEGGKVHITQMPASLALADGKDKWSVFQHRMLSEYYNTDAMLFNSVEKIDWVGFGYFRRKIGKPVWGIGPILNHNHRREKTSGSGGSGVSIEECKEWLDSKPPRSVLYVSFGSQNTLTRSQTTEMAKALEVCGKFFIWVIRPPLGAELTTEFKAEEFLPTGFEERVKRRGLLVRRWAPQMEILSHESTGAFLSHCGWNSTLEGITHGVPIIGWPMAAEQFFNVKFLEGELGICVELARGNGCEVCSEDIVGKIEIVMGQDLRAKEVRRRAFEVLQILQNARKEEDDDGKKKESSLSAMDEFFKMAFTKGRERNNLNAIKFTTQKIGN